MTTQPQDLQQVLDDELALHEQVLWTGQPLPGRLAMQILRLTLPVGAIIIALTVLWIWYAVSRQSDLRELFGLDSAGLLAAALAIPGLWAGVKLLAIPLTVLRGARRVHYVVTDRRALVIDPSAKERIRSFDPEQIRSIKVKRRPDGSGNILFERDVVRTPDHVTIKQRGLLACPDVDAAADALRQVIAEARDTEPQPSAAVASGRQVAPREQTRQWIARRRRTSRRVTPRQQAVIGAMFLALGIIGLVICGRTGTLVCTRIAPQQVDGVIHRTWRGVIPLADRSVSGLTKAALELHASSPSIGIRRGGGHAHGYLIVLHAAAGQVPLGLNSSLGIERRKAVVRRINEFLADPAAGNLVVSNSDYQSVWVICVPAAFMAAGLFVLTRGIRLGRHRRQEDAGVKPNQ